MENDTERDEKEPKTAKEVEKTEDTQEEEETVEDLKKGVAEEIKKMVAEEVGKVAKTPMRKALADDTLGGDEEPKERKKAKTWFEWFRKFHGTLDEEGEEWWQ